MYMRSLAMYRVFKDRRDAGRALAPEVRRCGLKNPIILGLPRGGLPVAFEVAAELGAPLDTIIVRKLGAPFQPELAIGAIASGGVRVLNEDVLAIAAGVDDETIEKIVARETTELRRREQQYRGDHPYPDLQGRDVVLVDDGIATGATMWAAIEAVQSMGPSSITVAVPTASKSSLRKLSTMVDNVVCLESPESFYAVGQFYREFGQTTDDEVRELLQQARSF
jgi:putative phosphoribosyl transferase